MWYIWDLFEHKTKLRYYLRLHGGDKQDFSTALLAWDLMKVDFVSMGFNEGCLILTCTSQFENQGF